MGPAQNRQLNNMIFNAVVGVYCIGKWVFFPPDPHLKIHTAPVVLYPIVCKKCLVYSILFQYGTSDFPSQLPFIPAIHSKIKNDLN